MLEAIVICTVYVVTLFVITKLFGVPYTDIVKNTKNIKRGIVYPIGIGAILLTIYAAFAGWFTNVFTFSPQISSLFLWTIPLATLASIVARLMVNNFRNFDIKGKAFLILGTFIVGFSEELLVRGIVVQSLQESGYSVLLIGVISSTIFGALHFMNFFNGQDMKTTAIQVAGTTLMGLNFYITLVITGSLWIPIIFHFLYDFSILALGYKPKLPNNIATKVISISTLAMFILPVIGLIFLR